MTVDGSPRMRAWILEGGAWRCVGIIPFCPDGPGVLKDRVGGIGAWKRDARGWHIWTWRFRRAWLRLEPVKA